MDWNLALEIFGTIIGLIYLYYEYKAHPLLWVMSIIMPAISIGVYFNAGLYADMGINIYYILAGIYGYLVWTFKNKTRRKVELPIIHAPLPSPYAYWPSYTTYYNTTPIAPYHFGMHSRLRSASSLCGCLRANT